MSARTFRLAKLLLGFGVVVALVGAVVLAAVGAATVQVFDVLMVRPMETLPAALGRMGIVALGATVYGLGIAAAAGGFAAVLWRQAVPPVTRLLVILAGLASVVASAVVLVGQWSVVSVFHVVATSDRTMTGAEMSAMTAGSAVWVQVGYSVLILVPMLLAAASLATGSAPSNAERDRADMAPAVVAALVIALAAGFALLHVLGWWQAAAIRDAILSRQPARASEFSRLFSGILNKGLLAALLLMLQGGLWIVMGIFAWRRPGPRT
jgi:hypothetical protein